MHKLEKVQSCVYKETIFSLISLIFIIYLNNQCNTPLKLMMLKAAVIIALLQYEAHLTVSFPLRCATARARPLQWSKVRHLKCQLYLCWFLPNIGSLWYLLGTTGLLQLAGWNSDADNYFP